MNERQERLIGLLAEAAPAPLTAAEAARSLHVSERTVRNDVAAVNRAFEQDGADIRALGHRGIGYRLVADDPDALPRFLETLSANRSKSHPDVDLFLNGIVELVLGGRRHTIQTLADALFTNRRTLMRELLRWESMLDEYGLVLKRSRTLSIEGPELNIRMFVIGSIVAQAGDEAAKRVFPQLIDEHLRRDEHPLESILQSGENTPSQNALMQALVFLAITAARARQGRTLAEHRVGELAATLDSPNMGLYELAVRAFDIPHPETELMFLSYLETSATVRWSPSIARTWSSRHENAPVVARALIRNLVPHGVTVTDEFAAYLEIVIDTALARRDLGCPVLDADRNQLAWRYLPEHLIVTRSLFDTPGWSEHPLFPNDCSRITMLLLPCFHRIHGRSPLHAGIVVNAGIPLAMFARSRIGYLLGKSIVVDRLIGEDDLAAGDEQLDFLITFSPVGTDIPHVRVSPMIGEDDIAAIRRLAAQVRERRYAHGLLEGAAHRATLACRTYVAFEQHVWQDLRDSGAWSGSVGELHALAAYTRFVLDGRLVIPLHERHVRQRALFSYEIKRGLFADGMEVTSALVACIPVDDPDFSSIVHELSRLAEE